MNTARPLDNNTKEAVTIVTGGLNIKGILVRALPVDVVSSMY